MIRITLALVLLLSLVLPASASAQTAPDCPMTPTISALQVCVQHAVSTPGVARSLLAELNAAQSALNRGQPRVAILLLQAFIREVQALSGHGIEPEHASHLIQHAELVIQALR